MAVLTIVEEKRTLTAVPQIQEYLAGIGIEYDRWELLPGIDKDSTSETILETYAARIAEVKQKGGFVKVDVVNVNASTPGLNEMLSRFSAEHWHDEDEVRFIVHGSGVYHVHPPSGPVAKLEVEPGDMIHVPHGTLHWFDLCATREIKSIRFFQDAEGWTPHYTESSLEQKFEPVCFGPNYFPHAKVTVEPLLPLK
jgi:1,2-dihydroxy-3-keto-5-methylthiopentene dioxygenase